MRVLDASIAVEWFAPRNAATGQLAEGVLDALRDDAKAYVVPALFFCELHAVLCRKLSLHTDTKAAVALVERLGLSVLPWECQLRDRATELAYEWRLSGYDAIYVAAAEIVEGRWLTLDGRAHRRLKKLGRSELLS